MKRLSRRNFTLIELMFVVAILVILIGISWVAGTKVLRSQAKSKTKAEITMLVSAVKQYRDRHGMYPEVKGALNFAQYLSKVLPNSGWTGKRPMYIDYKKNNINTDIDTYDDANAGNTLVMDPYEQDYIYVYDSTEDGTFLIYSAGLDGDETQPDKPSEYDSSASGNADNVSSNDL